MRLDPFERRRLYEVALVSAMLAGGLVAILIFSTTWSALTLILIGIIAFLAAFAAIVLFASS
jgi:hypothetical protein